MEVGRLSLCSMWSFCRTVTPTRQDKIFRFWSESCCMIWIQSQEKYREVSALKLDVGKEFWKMGTRRGMWGGCQVSCRVTDRCFHGIVWVSKFQINGRTIRFMECCRNPSTMESLSGVTPFSEDGCIVLCIFVILQSLYIAQSSWSFLFLESSGRSGSIFARCIALFKPPSTKHMLLQDLVMSSR